MLVAVALGEALEHLVLAGSDGELGVTFEHRRLALLEHLRMSSALCLDALEERLASNQFAGVERLRLAYLGPVFAVRLLQMSFCGTQLGLGARARCDRQAQLLLGLLLFALAQRANTLEPKAKNGSIHDLVIGRWDSFLSPMPAGAGAPLAVPANTGGGERNGELRVRVAALLDLPESSRASLSFM